jgi:hypothetical protein
VLVRVTGFANVKGTGTAGLLVLLGCGCTVDCVDRQSKIPILPGDRNDSLLLQQVIMPACMLFVVALLF